MTMRRGVLRTMAVAATGIVAVAVSTTPVIAHRSGNGLQTPQLSVYPYNYNDVWQPAMNKAGSNWNATSTPVRVYKDSDSGSTITAKSYSNTWYGTYTRCGPSCFYIKLNSRTIARDASNTSNFITSVLVHELGHALNLAHNTVTSIMNRSRNRNSTTYTKPRPHDVSDVNAYY
ncbi:matrixin family metalloprotease [Nonomuraea sp. B10E15]|uniref:matrixin family metalloprotease n=1 Tax=unclassified Nonomuraea TaxID=2593643 RepID=UPI00325EC5AD